jgi:uncharacterized protein (UPF0335 family)
MLNIFNFFCLVKKDRGDFMSSKVWLIYIGPFIAFIATSATGILDNKVSFFVEKGLIYGELFIIIYIFVLSLGIMADRQQEKIGSLNLLIKHYEDDIKNKTVGLLDHYKRLNRFQLNEVLQDVMKAFTEKHAFVISSQLYKYSIQHTFENKVATTVIKLNYVEGYIDEREEQNSMLQAYYFVPTSLYNKYYEANYYIQKNKKYMFDFIFEIIDELNEEISQKDGIGDLHSIKFAFILLGMEALGLDGSVKILNDSDIEDTIRKKLKTGIMRGVLNSAEFFVFNYIATKEGIVSDKEGRIYLTKKIKVRGESHLFLITISKFINDSDRPTENTIGIGEEFQELIIDSIPGIKYNEV